MKGKCDSLVGFKCCSNFGCWIWEVCSWKYGSRKVVILLFFSLV